MPTHRGAASWRCCLPAPAPVRGQRRETPPHFLWLPAFTIRSPPCPGSEAALYGLRLLSTLLWPPGTGSGPGSLKAPLGERRRGGDAMGLLSWGFLDAPPPGVSTGRTASAAAAGVRSSPWAERGVLTGSTRTGGGAAAQLSPQKGPTAPAQGFQDRGPAHSGSELSMS